MDKQKMSTQKVQSIIRPRGGTTKAILMRHALRLFAERGYTATSTRDLANVADVNQAAIAYHFSNKDGLFQSVCEWVVTCLTTEILPVFTEFEKESMGKADMAALEKLLRSLFDIFWSDNSVKTEVLLLKRELYAQSHENHYLRRQLYDPTIARLQNIVLQYNSKISAEENYFIATMIFDSLLYFNSNEVSLAKIFGTRNISNIKKRKEISAYMQNVITRIILN